MNVNMSKFEELKLLEELLTPFITTSTPQMTSTITFILTVFLLFEKLYVGLLLGLQYAKSSPLKKDCILLTEINSFPLYL